MKLFILCLLVVGIAVLLLSIRIILQRNGRFPNTHVGGQKALRDKGISCHTSQHRDTQRQQNLAERIESRAKLGL